MLEREVIPDVRLWLENISNFNNQSGRVRVQCLGSLENTKCLALKYLKI